MSRTIFIVRCGALDTSGATKYGEAGHLFDRNPSLHAPTRFRERLYVRLSEVEYDPESDYLVISGPLAHITLAVAHITRRFGAIKLLIFNAQDSSYFPLAV